MPCTPRKARLLLKAGKAKVIKMVPFTLQLHYGSFGYFDLRLLDGTKIHASASYKQLKQVQRASALLVERRDGVSSLSLKA
jgi:RRXRR protein